MLSVNQMNAQIKMTEIWKASNVDNYPLKIDFYNVNYIYDEINNN